ncbi:AraC-type DNA-binding protein [Andreprevotia lacus DSM 23236]|jgi:AraC-like DNA-binding protein|uniref:AraC-type DNA-binding protein n=1 Tax=Andreprevotia lacus DSM 23236 TaxID=1121001 RepID=A0A1W1XIE0_9NEIS|nr:AraC family transcriptional regulator [Andreprevotia lacus]SMC23740.1 AraC-type DNA-binding protein [Andreprevotia lacus DSM 23236]
MPQIYQERFELGDATQQRLVGAQLSHQASYPPMWDRGIFMCGISEAGGTLEIERIDAPFHVLLFTRQGQGELFEGEQRWYTGPDTIAVLPSGGQRGFRHSGSEPWLYAWVLLSAVSRWQGLARPRCSVHASPDCVALNEAVALFHTEAERFDRQPGSDLAQPALELLVLALERALQPLREHAGWPRTLLALFDHIGARLQQDWPNERMAEQVGITPNHLHRLCVQHFGVAPARYLFQLRMQHARELLLHGQSVSAVANAVAYREVASFSRQFARHFGFSPSQTLPRFNQRLVVPAAGPQA